MLRRDLIKTSIDDWSEWYKSARKKMVKREHTLSLPKKHSIALIGVRRAGKTFATLEISKLLENSQHILYFNFEDPIIYSDNHVDNLDEILSVFIEYSQHSPDLIIFDEIHNINGWERWVRKIIDQQKYKLVITGSSAHMLSSEIATSIAGRCMSTEIWPLSFKEYLNFKQIISQNKNEYLGHLQQYLKWGGFPEIVQENDEVEKKRILKQYYNDIVLKDIMDRHQIRGKHVLNQLLIYYLTNISSLHSYSKIKKAFGIGIDTCSEYTKYCSEAFLIFEIPRFHYNLKVQNRDPKKIYAIDTGLRNTHSLSVTDDWGKLAENMVFIELKRREKEISYFKQKGEVDFLLTDSGRPIEAIQVCYSNLDDNKTYQRETTSLLECMQFTKLNKGKILTLSREEKIRIEKSTIEFIPLYKWLLEKN